MGEGCLAFTTDFYQVTWPRKFKIDVDKYNGETDPRIFLHLYSIAACATGADEGVMANWFPLALRGDARSRIFNLPERTISSWWELKEQFMAPFQGGYKHPGFASDLHYLGQLPGEMLRKYIQCFCTTMNNIPSVKEAAGISSFHANVRNLKMREKLSTHTIETTAGLFSLADNSVRERGTHPPRKQTQPYKT